MRREAYLARILINDLISRIEESKKQINNPNKEIADYHKNEIIKNREKIASKLKMTNFFFTFSL